MCLYQPGISVSKTKREMSTSCKWLGKQEQTWGWGCGEESDQKEDKWGATVLITVKESIEHKAGLGTTKSNGVHELSRMCLGSLAGYMLSSPYRNGVN